jgi:hypothetical protein
MKNTIVNFVKWLISALTWIQNSKAMKLLIKAERWIVFHYNSIWNTLHLKLSVRKANKRHKLTGKRWYVVPTDKNLMVVDNDWLKRYNAAPGTKKISQKQLSEMAYYSTGRGQLVRKV